MLGMTLPKPSMTPGSAVRLSLPPAGTISRKRNDSSWLQLCDKLSLGISPRGEEGLRSLTDVGLAQDLNVNMAVSSDVAKPLFRSLSLPTRTSAGPCLTFKLEGTLLSTCAS